MAVEALPHGFGDFSITMDAPLPAMIWPPQHCDDIHCQQHLEIRSIAAVFFLTVSMEELAWMLEAAEAELQVALGEVRHQVQEFDSLKYFIRRMAEECNLFEQQHRQILSLLLSSSPSPVAVFDHSALFWPSSVAHGATINGDRRAAASAQLGTKSPLAMDHHSSALLEPSSVARRAAKRPLAMDHQSSASLEPSSAAHSAAKRPLAMDNHSSALLEPSSVADSAVKSRLALDRHSSALLVPSSVARSAVKSPVPLEHSPALVEPSSVARSAAKRPLALEHSSALVEPSSVARSAAKRPLALDHHSSTLLEPSPVAHSAPVVENRSAAVAAAAQLELLVAKRPLPVKGRLMQAVMDAGPLLQMLMVTGPMPKWRNPPPMNALTNAMIPAPSSSRAPMGLPRSTH